MAVPERTLLSRDDIVRGLVRLDQLARARQITIDLSIYGGAALAIGFEMRPSTRDVDAVIRSDVATAIVRELAAEVAEEQGWPSDWLNDGVKGFVSGHERMEPVIIPGIPVDREGGLRVQLPTAEYLFAMKCMAMRSGIDGPHDFDDIRGLAREIGITDADAAMKVIEDFYPRRLIPSKVEFGVRELLEHDGSPPNG